MAGAGVKRRALAALRRAPLALSMPLVRRRIRKAKADQVAVGVARRQMEFLLAETRRTPTWTPWRSATSSRSSGGASCGGARR